MSSGRIMTLSVETLNKLYFQFIEQFIVPHLVKSLPEVTDLLKKKSAYEVHRYLEDLLNSSSVPQQYSTHTNSSVNGSVNSFTQNASTPANNLYQYALPTEMQKATYNDGPFVFGKAGENQFQQKKNFTGKLGMRKAMTGIGFEDRAFDKKHSHDDSLMPIPNLNQNAGSEQAMQIPILTTTISSDYKFERVDSRQKGKSTNKISVEEAMPKAKVMREWVKKISKIFNENHSKIEKYSQKADPQAKLFNLNVSTKLQRKEEGVKIKDYQFHVRTDSHSRLY